MATRPLPSSELLKQLLDYDPSTGALTWRARALSSFATLRAGKIWNERFAGQKALNSLSKRGYLLGVISGKKFYSHRVIWKLMTGDEPPEIDHINGDRTDNRFSNLRPADRHSNGRNLSIKSNNTSGINGVYWAKTCRVWVAYGRVDRKMYYIGRFKTLEDAAAAREAWDRKKGFHINHGAR